MIVFNYKYTLMFQDKKKYVHKITSTNTIYNVSVSHQNIFGIICIILSFKDFLQLEHHIELLVLQ